MNTKFLRTDKPKAKFAQSNINLLYKGNASEIQSKPTLRSARLQLVGKLQGTRRNPPPPPWVPSIKAEMGGQDTKVNLVPPGGSGWGTGSSNNTTEADPKAVPTMSILKNITEVIEQDSNDSKDVTCAESPAVALVKPPQKPFYAPRSSKAAPTKSSNDDSSDGRPLAGKSAGPMLPFYNRPSTTSLSSSTLQDSEFSKSSTDEKPIEAKDVPNNVATPLTGWAALSTEETDFQERINFSDDDEKETAKQSLDKVCNRLPKNTWVSTSMRPQVPVQIPYSRTAWDQPACFNPGSPMQQTFNASFCDPNDGVFGEPSSIPISHVDILPNRDVVLLADQFQETSFSASEAQLQAQREERTLAFKSAVNRAQMARKKRMEFEDVGPKLKDQSVVAMQSSLADVNAFSHSILQSGTPAITCPAFSIHGPVSRSPQQHNVKPVVDALYSNGLANLMHPMTFGNGHMPNHMKSQAHLANNLPPWNPESYSVNSQPSFMHPSYSLSDSSKLPTDQGFYFNSDPFATNAFDQQVKSKNGHVQGLQAEKPLHSYASSMGETRMVDHLSFHPTRSHVSQQPPPSPILENRMESEINKELIAPSSRAVVINNHPIQISAHPDGSRTAFTPPKVEVFPPQNLQSQPIKQQQQQPHITPLMEVNISGKWSEKDFDTFLPMSSNRNYTQSSKPVCSFAKNSNDEKAGGNRYMPLSSNGRHYRGSAPRDSKNRSTRRALQLEENRIDGQPTNASATYSGYEGQQGYSRRQRCYNIISDTYPRQQRVRGSNRIPRSHRGTPPDYDECQQHCADFQRHSGSYNRRDTWISGSNGYKGSKQVDNVIEKAGNGRGRRNICPGGRRYAGNENVPKPSDNYSKLRNADEEVEIANITTDNVDSNVFSDSEQGTSTLQPPGVDIQQYHSQKQLRRGSNSGRPRRGGQHGGSQRQPQRRDRTDRANTRRQNNRRPPDDDDHDYKGGPSNSNGASTAATNASTSGCSTGKGEGKTNTDSHSNTTSNDQQQNGSVNALQSFGANLVASAVKPRSHAHSGGYSHCIKNRVLGRPVSKIMGEIVPLMSINAEAPPSYCDNLSFLDPLSPPTFKLSTSDSHPVEPITGVKDIECVVTCTSTSTEDGFVEVCSQTGKTKQKKKLQQKKQKPSISPEDQSTTVSTTIRDFLKSRGKSALSATDQKSSKVFNNAEMSAKNNHHPLSTVSVNLNQAPPRHLESVGGKMTDSAPAQRVNAWLKPLQDTISKKAVAAVSSTMAVVPTTVSSYAWSVVVGSRANASTVTSCASKENIVMSQIAEADENVIDSKPLQAIVSGSPSTAAIARNPKSLSTMPVTINSSAVPHTRQSNLGEKLPQAEDLIQLSNPSRVSAAITSTAATATSANVCKVRPQKQPTNVALISSSTAPFTHSSKSESISFPMSTAYSTPGNTVLINTPQFRRSIGDFGDWLGKNSGAYTSNSLSMFFDGYRSKKMEAGPESSLGLTPAAAAAAAALYLQQQQQPFRQTLQPLQQQQPMMGFGLADLNMRHQNNRMNSGCSQSAMSTDNYFTSPSFGAGSAGQAGSQQCSLYPQAAPSQQRGFPWQHQQHHSQQEAAVMAAAVASAVGPQAAALWSSNYTPPPLTHHHPPYVGVIGADRPSSTSITPRLQPGNASAMLYGSGSLRGGNRAPGVGAALFAQTAPPPPSGLYASSPTHPTPPPPMPYDPTFAYTNGRIPNSSNIFAHQSGAAALLTAPHHSRSAHSIGDPSHTPHPPVFINASHAPFPAAPTTISVHGLVGPPTASLTTHGLHF